MTETLTVRELIAALSEMDGDLPVIAEGCDCSNSVVGATFEEGRTVGAWVTPPHAYLTIDTSLAISHLDSSA